MSAGVFSQARWHRRCWSARRDVCRYPCGGENHEAMRPGVDGEGRVRKG